MKQTSTKGWAGNNNLFLYILLQREAYAPALPGSSIILGEELLHRLVWESRVVPGREWKLHPNCCGQVIIIVLRAAGHNSIVSKQV